jgi:hypothetical protein
MSYPKFEVIEQPAGRLRLITDEQCWLEFKPVWASPLSHPGKYLALLDGKDKEILIVNEPDELDEGTRKLLISELERRVLTAQITEIIEAQTEFGVTYWLTETSRGRKEFVTQSLQENALWLAPHQLLLIDVNGNRFEIPDTQALDPESQKKLFATV